MGLGSSGVFSFRRAVGAGRRHRAEGNAESEIDPPVSGFVPVAVGRADAVRGTAPAAAATHVGSAGRRTLPVLHLAARPGAVPIQAPFPDVAQHVVKAPGVWFFRADLARA